MENQPQPQKPEQKPATPKSPSPIGKYGVYALCIAAGILGTKFAFDYLAPRFKPQSRTSTAASRAPVPPAASASKTAPQLTATLDTVKKKVKQVIEPYELNGLYFCGEEAYALINNKIAQVGDEIDGAVVTAIEKEEVLLRHNDKVIRLRSRNK